MSSILDTIKKSLNVSVEDNSFDTEILMGINTSISKLTRVGLGPSTGFRVNDNVATWTELLGPREDLEDVKTFIQLQTRLLFDPPSSSYMVDAIERQLEELKWSINVVVDKEVP